MEIDFEVLAKPGLLGPPPDAYVKAIWNDLNHWRHEQDEPIFSFTKEEWELRVAEAKVRLLLRLLKEHGDC